MSNAGRKSAQEYIDETPVWADGTAIDMSPMTPMQWKLWGLATAGKFFEGMVVFVTGVALPLIVLEFGLNDWQKGMVSAASLFGILIGATALGGLSDKYGRKLIFIIEMLLFTIFLSAITFSRDFAFLLFALFGAGVALGCDYPTAHLVISESIASRNRGKLVLSAFGFQAVGMLFGTMIGYLILYENPNLSAWRWMYGAAILPAAIVTLARLRITQSPHWLVAQGRLQEAEVELLRLLRRVPLYPKEIRLRLANSDGGENNKCEGSYKTLFQKKHRKATIFASLPWFLQDLSTYGIGIFTPTILATVFGASRSENNLADIIANDLLAAKGAAFLDILLIVGILLAIILSDRVGRVKLQTLGFFGCAAGLALVAISQEMHDNMQTVFIFAGFMLFNLMTNLGPNSQTYLIAGEVFPTDIRGKGAGFAASFAKIGAVMTAFLFPVLLADIGTSILLCILVGTSLVGALVTVKFGIETKGVNLEKIGR